MSSTEPPAGVRGQGAGGGPLNGVACDWGGGQEGRGIVGGKGEGKEWSKGEGMEDVAKTGVSFMCGKEVEEAIELRELLVKGLWQVFLMCCECVAA